MYLTRKSELMVIDKDMKLQYEKEKLYWTLFLERIIHVIKYFSSRGLPFCGNNKQLGFVHNGSYLGLIEFLA